MYQLVFKTLEDSKIHTKVISWEGYSMFNFLI